MISITQTDTLSESEIDFVKNQWKIADKKQFGREVAWQKEHHALIAKEDDQIVGVLEYTTQAGVMYIDEIIIDSTKQGKGVGTTLMQQAESIARDKKLHKIHLNTGEPWKAVEFYKKLGYIKTGELPNHYEGLTYIIFSKML